MTYSTRRLIKFPIHLIESVIFISLIVIFAILGYKKASAFGGFLGRNIGKLLTVNNVARKNISAAMPEKSTVEIEEIIDNMWDNLGRTAGEFIHISRKNVTDNIEIKNQHVIDSVKKSGKLVLFVSAHLANWEVPAVMVNKALGLDLCVIYRHANNPIFDWIIRIIRQNYSTVLSSKNENNREIINSIKQNISIGMLIDQKMNNGIPVKFFGRDAMTASAVARLAIKYNIPIIPVRAVRNPPNKNKPYFTLIFDEPIHLTTTNNQNEDIQNTMEKLNLIIENWIRQYPEQWFWVHRRWPKTNHK